MVNNIILFNYYLHLLNKYKNDEIFINVDNTIFGTIMSIQRFKKNARK